MFTITLVMPNCCRYLILRSRSDCPLTNASAFGWMSVQGLNLVPSPAEKIIPCINHSSVHAKPVSVLPILAFLHMVFEFDLHFEFVSQMSCKCIGSIYASMLTTSTPKAYHKAFPATRDVIFNGDIDYVEYTMEKLSHF